MSNLDHKYDRLKILLKKLPAKNLPEDFDKQFLEKFEKSLNTPRAARLVAPAWAASATLAALFIIAWLGLDSVRNIPAVRLVNGQASVQTAQALAEGQEIKTDGASWVIFDFENKYSVKLHPSSNLKILKLKRKWIGGENVLSLSRGEAFININENFHGKYPVRIETPYGFAKALGTQFGVQSMPMEASSKISVLRGIVEVGGTGNPLLVHAGEQTTVNSKTGALPPRLMPEKDKKFLKSQFGFASNSRVLLLLSMGTNRVYELLKPCGIYVKLENRNIISNDLETIARAATSEEGREKGLQAAINIEENVSYQEEIDATQVLLFLGAYYNHLGEHVSAVRIFERVYLEDPESLYGSLALMAAAIVYEKKLNNNQKALDWAHEVLRKYPDSYEAVEAKNLVDRLTLPTKP